MATPKLVLLFAALGSAGPALAQRAAIAPLAPVTPAIVAPPPLGQAAFLEGLESIGEEQFERVFQALGAEQQNKPMAVGVAAPVAAPASSFLPHAPAPGLLLKDATLEDIVRHLHAMNIEPTFRHLLPSDRYD